MARRPKKAGRASLVGYGTVLAVLLLVPTLVVLTFMRGLPDSSSGGFKKHDAGGSGSSRAAARPGPRLHEQLDSNGQQAKAGSAALGRSAGLGQPDRSRSSSQAGAKGAAAASLHADSAAQQQQELGQRGAVEQADQHTLEHRLQKQQQGGQKHEQIPNQAEAGQQQAQQVQQQAQQAQRQQQPQGRQQVRQGQVVRGQAPQQPEEPPDPQQQAARKQRYAAKKAQQAQQQLQPAAVYTGSYPRWPSALPKGSGKPQALPGCRDRDDPQQCATWERQGDCDTNPGGDGW